MKKLILLITCLALFGSCKERITNGFSSETVKVDIAKALSGSVWESSDPDAYYTKIVINKNVVQVTKKGGSSVAVGYDVTNMTGPQSERPNRIQIRLKSGLQLDELYLSEDYKQLESLVYDRSINQEKSLSAFYKLVN